MSLEATVFIVDDDAAMRDSLALLVRSAGLMAETYPSAEAFLETYEPTRPGCLLLDIRMPTMSGLELQESLVVQDVGLPIIIVSGHADVPVAVRAMRAGAVDVIEKPYDSAYLKQRIHEALEKDARERQAQDRRRACAERLASLTARERKVMSLLIEGNTVKAIALQLGLSHNTVQIHRARILEKVRVGSVPELAWLAVSAGIRDPEQTPQEA